MTRRSVAIKTLDATFSKAIRLSYDHTCAYPNCPYCKNIPGGADDCAHYRRRRHSAGRWYPDNCAALCRQIHSQLDMRQEELVAFFRALNGDTRWDWLIERLQKPRKYTPYNRWEMNEHFKREIERVQTLRLGGESGFISLVSWD